MGQFKKLLRKAFLNKEGELSFRKTGTTLISIGGFFVFGPIEGAKAIGETLVALGTAIAGIGFADKQDRKEQK